MLYSGYTYRPGGWLLPAPRRFLKVDLKGSYPETGKRAFFWQRPPHTFLELTRSLNRALDDRGIGGLYLNLEGISLGWSQLREVRELVKQFRRSGKPVYAYLGMLPNNRQYYLASAADGIAMRRYDELLLIGLLAEVTFYKGTLDKLGIVADLEHAGKYKAASELLTRDSISEYHRESLNQLLDDTYAAFLEEIADGRRLSGDSLQRLIDGAPMVSRDAIAAGLVDEVLYPDQVKEWQKRVFGGQRGVALAEYDRRQPYS